MMQYASSQYRSQNGQVIAFGAPQVTTVSPAASYPTTSTAWPPHEPGRAGPSRRPLQSQTAW